MKALFVTTGTVDTINHIAAWESVHGMAPVVSFETGGFPNHDEIVASAKRHSPEVIFYIGAVNGSGLPCVHTFRELRSIAPLVNLCSDAADVPWHPVLEYYRKQECFDLQVGIDGVMESPVDLVTLTPVDPRPFEGEVRRDILCGFSGSVGYHGGRATLIRKLHMWNLVEIRKRRGPYKDHVDFMKRCKSTINAAHTGTGRFRHIKGRVLEAGWAGCALIENATSPIARWFPADCYTSFRDIDDAAKIIKAGEFNGRRLSEEVRAKYRPEQIYGEILAGVDLTQ